MSLHPDDRGVHCWHVTRQEPTVHRDPQPVHATLFWLRCCHCGEQDNGFRTDLVRKLGEAAAVYLDWPGYRHGPYRPPKATDLKPVRHDHCWHSSPRPIGWPATEATCCWCDDPAAFDGSGPAYAYRMATGHLPRPREHCGPYVPAAGPGLTVDP